MTDDFEAWDEELSRFILDGGIFGPIIDWDHGGPSAREILAEWLRIMRRWLRD